MEPQTPSKPTLLGKTKRLIFKCIPFLVAITLILLVMIPLNSSIQAKKEALAKQQSLEKSTEKALTNVITMQIRPDLVKEKISLPGVAKPWLSLEVVAEVRGKVTQKKVEEGRQVNKGDILAIIDKRDYQNAYNSALASYEAALATQKRLNALVKKNFVTESQLDDAVARVKTSKATLENARLDLSRCEILSPIKGVVDRVHIETGSFLSSGDPVVQILQIDRLKIEVGIPESDVDAVRKLDTFEITIDALDQKKYLGSSHYLYKTTDSFARLYNLEIRVDNPDGQILPDMFARVNVIKNQDPNGLAVPMYALVNRNEQIGVFVENGGVARFQPVRPGFLDGWKTQIIEGLSPDDHVVVVGHRIIEDGEQVIVTRTIRDMEELGR